MDAITEQLIINLDDTPFEDLRVLPTIEDFYSELNTFTITSMICGSALFVGTVIMFLLATKETFENVPSRFVPKVLTLRAIYSIISAAALLNIYVPKLFLISDSIMIIAFALGINQFYNLCLDYVGGEETYLKHADTDDINLRTPPCCCCCLCLNPIAVSKFRMSILRAMIIQMPIVQLIIMIALNIIYMERAEAYEEYLLYFAPFIACSIMTGMWSVNIICRIVMPHIPENNIRFKMLSIQLVVIFCKFQVAILNISLANVDFGGIYPITNTVYKQYIIQLAVLCEMFLMSFIARKAYQKPSVFE